MGTREYDIYQYIQKNGNKTKIKKVCDALGKDNKTKEEVKTKISLMGHYGLVTFDGDSVSVSSGRR
jgi:hypothetical protein